MNQSDNLIIAARYQLELLDKYDMIDIVNRWLDEGIYYDEFLYVLDDDQYPAAAFAKALAKVTPIPDRSTAQMIILRYYLEKIVAHTSEPFPWLAELMSMIRRFGLLYQIGKTYKSDYFFEAITDYQLDELMSLYYQYDDGFYYGIDGEAKGLDPETIQANDAAYRRQLNPKIVAAAQKWLSLASNRHFGN